MAAVGGSIQSVSIRGRLFAVAADAEAQRKLGGWEAEVEANGNGTARILKTRVPLMVDGLTLEVDDDRGDQEFLQSVADGNDFVTIMITWCSGAESEGRATITGELNYSSANATCPVTLKGPGTLTRQA